MSIINCPHCNLPTTYPESSASNPFICTKCGATIKTQIQVKPILIKSPEDPNFIHGFRNWVHDCNRLLFLAKVKVSSDPNADPNSIDLKNTEENLSFAERILQIIPKEYNISILQKVIENIQAEKYNSISLNDIEDAQYNLSLILKSLVEPMEQKS
jgi:hypothetical protein